MNAISLEEILGMTQGVQDWSCSNTSDGKTVTLSGAYTPKGTDKKVTVNVSLYHSKKVNMFFPDTIINRYNVSVMYGRSEVAQLSGDDAKGIFEIADGVYTKKRDAEEAARQKREAEEKRIREKKKTEDIDELKQVLEKDSTFSPVKKVERLPWYRRMGK